MKQPDKVFSDDCVAVATIATHLTGVASAANISIGPKEVTEDAVQMLLLARAELELEFRLATHG